MGRYQPWVVVYFRGDELGSFPAMAELERSNIKERQLAGIKRAKAEGRALGRERPSTMKMWLYIKAPFLPGFSTFLVPSFPVQ